MSKCSYHGATSRSKHDGDTGDTGIATHVGVDPVTDEKERNVLFNDTLDTFYLSLYGVGHLDNERGDPLLKLYD